MVLVIRPLAFGHHYITPLGGAVGGALDCKKAHLRHRSQPADNNNKNNNNEFSKRF